eukprot:CAMPEP_0119375204 /NCGR_PEP_ID=MMETSP1334-20130426/34310_1 /TAXON_ID=127549 /ORGANISM="Calcidiscus leptoporus, Strain RCC1130" /LENGTH=683 /DNA_ID=CAMNT_0007393443 /DNA_START=117 /DNA_END=2168 /DNA_ORIENTATION=-
MDFTDAIAGLTNPDDSVVGADEMTRVIELVTSSSALGKTDQELLVSSLVATKARDLLDQFVDSDALAQLDKWLAQSLQAEQPAHTLLLLELLGHLPIRVQSLQASGVGKTVNKMRKSEHAGVQQASAKLLASWKEMVAKAPAGTDNAPSAHSAKRVASDGGENDPKRLRTTNAAPVGGTHQSEDDGSLDSALSAQAQPRKASLKPDHIRARRPAQMLSTNIPSRRSTLQSSVELPSPSLPSPPNGGAAAAPSSWSEMPPSRTSPPLPGFPAAMPTTLKEGHEPLQRRVKWAVGDKLVEMREYIVDSKRSSAQVDFRNTYAADVERERSTWHLHRKAFEQPWVTPLYACGAEGAAASSAAPATPAMLVLPATADASTPPATPSIQPTVEWVTPPLLDESLWPDTKGDLSTEREAQRQRRSRTIEVIFRSFAELAADPEEEPASTVDDSVEIPVIPFDKLAQPPAPVQAERAPTADTDVQMAQPGGGGQPPPPPPPQRIAQQMMGMGVCQNGCMPVSGLTGAAMPLGGAGAVGGMRAAGMGGLAAMCPVGGVAAPVRTADGAMGGASNLTGGGSSAMGGGTSNLTEKLMLQMMLQSSAQGLQQSQGMAQGRGQAFNGTFSGPRDWREMASHPKFKTKPCRYFAAGGCKNGDRCTFVHDPNFLGDPADFYPQRDFNGQNRFGFPPR